MTGRAIRPAHLAEIARPIRARWQAAAHAIVETGALLIEARANLPHGQFEAMVENELPFGPRTAQRLMEIARHEWLSKATHTPLLPPSWGTLHELSRLPAEALDSALADGLIRPDMERADATLLRRPAPAPGDAPPIETVGTGYRAILADPGWHYRTWSERGQIRSPSRHYRTMTTREIAALPVGDLAAADSVLVLWATWPCIFEARLVLEAWGFAYATGGAWVKSSPTGRARAFGTGYILRNACDPFLVGTCGRPRTNGAALRNLIESAAVEGPTRGHSRKPDSMYELIETLVPGGPYVELFARAGRPGWDRWGNEIDKFGGSADD